MSRLDSPSDATTTLKLSMPVVKGSSCERSSRSWGGRVIAAVALRCRVAADQTKNAVSRAPQSAPRVRLAYLSRQRRLHFLRADVGGDGLGQGFLLFGLPVVLEGKIYVERERT